jgi:hypothetical protein
VGGGAVVRQGLRKFCRPRCRRSFSTTGANIGG